MALRSLCTGGSVATSRLQALNCEVAPATCEEAQGLLCTDSRFILRMYSLRSSFWISYTIYQEVGDVVDLIRDLVPVAFIVFLPGYIDSELS